MKRRGGAEWVTTSPRPPLALFQLCSLPPFLFPHPFLLPFSLFPPVPFFLSLLSPLLSIPPSFSQFLLPPSLYSPSLPPFSLFHHLSFPPHLPPPLSSLLSPAEALVLLLRHGNSWPGDADPITAAPPDHLVGTVPYGLKGEEEGDWLERRVEDASQIAP